MALVVEDGTGLSTAESYASVADVTTFASNYGDTTWSGLTTTQQEVALRKATRYLESQWRELWRGIKLTLDQALSWPRWDAVDENGYLLASDEVPTAVVNACCEAALLTGAATELEPDIARLTSRVKAGSVEVEYAKGADPQTFRTKVYGHVKHLLGSATLERSA